MTTAPQGVGAAANAIGTALVLGGGGGRGAAQLGVLRALAERGIVPDAVIGTSVGALNAAAVAALPFDDAVAALEEIWHSPQTRNVFRPQVTRMVMNRVRRNPWLRDGDCLTDLIDFALDYLDVPATFEGLALPLKVVVTDLHNGTPQVIDSGSLRDPLRASCSVPGVFPPVKLGDRLYVDGGVIENCSLATAAALNPKRIIAIDLSADLEMPAIVRWGQVMSRVVQVAQHARVVADYDRFSTRLPVTLICPRFSLGKFGFTDFTGVAANARTAATDLLQRIMGADGAVPSGLFYVPVAAS